MSSKILVDEIAPKTTGGAVKGASNVLETIPMLCDGGSYTGISGTYTPTNVTAAQPLTTTYTDLNGSVIDYTPPTGTVTVVYEFTMLHSVIDAHAIGHYKFFIDGTEVTNARKNVATSGNPEIPVVMRYIIPIGGTADSATGRQASWSGAKTLKMQGREYGSSNEATLFVTQYWDGAGSAQFSQPTLTITAIGSAYNG